MPRTNYCLPLDVVRRFDPKITSADLDNNEYITVDDRETIRSRIEGVESEFEDDTGTALREVRVGSQGTPGTYEHLEAKRSVNFPTSFTLEHRNVLPFDSSKGDQIEVRTSRDSWKDITADEGSRWVLSDPRQGKLEFYSRLQHTIQFRVRPGVRFIRLTYRYGALGGSATEGGQTTLTESLSGSTTPGSLSVADASRIPNEGGTMLVDGSEYVRVDSVDAANDTVSIASRGLRRTDETSSHSSGVVLHYCPMRVREAIAARTAREAVLYDDWVNRLPSSDEPPTPDQKLDEWQSEYDKTRKRYTRWHYA